MRKFSVQFSTDIASIYHKTKFRFNITFLDVRMVFEVCKYWLIDGVGKVESHSVRNSGRGLIISSNSVMVYKSRRPMQRDRPRTTKREE
jgi:hypothetical protein